MMGDVYARRREAVLYELGAQEIEIVRRALALRKRREIGVLWAEHGRYYISENEIDPYGSRVSVTLVRLREIVEAGEALAAKKPPAREDVRFEAQTHNCA